MIKLIIKGGLGNQMFQYATAYSVAKQLSYKLEIDLSFIKNRIPIPGFTQRSYELGLFDISEPTTTFFKNSFLDKYFSYPFEKLLVDLGVFHSYIEKDTYGFDEKVFNIKDSTFIEGYFNNHRYFEQYALDIKNIFNTEKLFDESFKKIESTISSINSVSINIRRGDYLNAKHKNVFVFLDTEYYKKAIHIIRQKVKNPHFFIFSVDFPENDDSYFVDELGLKRSEITLLGQNYIGHKFRTYLRLISICKHNIISNSTFAFWGAYLNKNQNRIIISPNKWMNNGTHFEMPTSWEQI